MRSRRVKPRPRRPVPPPRVRSARADHIGFHLDLGYQSTECCGDVIGLRRRIFHKARTPPRSAPPGTGPGPSTARRSVPVSRWPPQSMVSGAARRRGRTHPTVRKHVCSIESRLAKRNGTLQEVLRMSCAAGRATRPGAPQLRALPVPAGLRCLRTRGTSPTCRGLPRCPRRDGSRVHGHYRAASPTGHRSGVSPSSKERSSVSR